MDTPVPTTSATPARSAVLDEIAARAKSAWNAPRAERGEIVAREGGRGDEASRTSASRTSTKRPRAEFGRCRAFVQGWRAARTGESQCKNTAEDAGGFCALHKKASRELGAKTGDERGVAKVLKRYEKMGDQLEVSPLTAMLTLIKECAGNVAYYRDEVRSLQKLVIRGKKETEEVAKVVVLYNDERDRLQRYIADAVRVGVDVKQLRLYELQAHAVVGMAQAICERLGLSGTQRQLALEHAADFLRSYRDPQDAWASPFDGLGHVAEGDGDIIDVRADNAHA